MAQNPNLQKTTPGRSARAKQFIKKPFNKIFIKSSLPFASTQQQQLSLSTLQLSTSSHHRREPTSLSPQQLASSSTGQLIWGFSDESSSSSSLQLAYSLLSNQQLATSSQEQLPSFSALHTIPSQEQFQIYFHNNHQPSHEFQPRPSQIPDQTPSVAMSGSESLPIEETRDFKKLPAVERANVFIKHVVFEENKELSEDKTDYIKIKCDKTWTELVDLGTFNEALGTKQCQKLVRAPVIGEEICHKLWLRLANIARKGSYTNEPTDLDGARTNFLIEGKAEAFQKKAAEKDGARKKTGGKEAGRRTSELGASQGSTTSRMSKIFSCRRKMEPGAGNKDGEEEVPKDEQPFWQTPEPHKLRQPPPEHAAKDTPVPEGLLAQLEYDKDVIQALLSPVEKKKKKKKKVVFANEIDAENEGEASKQEETAEGANLEQAAAAKDVANKNKRKATETKEDSDSRRPDFSRRKTWAGRMSDIGRSIAYGHGASGSNNPKDERPRMKSV